MKWRITLDETAKTKMRKWPYIFVVHDHNFMKFGHQIACNNTKHLQKMNSNDLHMTSNDFEITLSSLFSSYLTFVLSYCTLITCQ